MRFELQPRPTITSSGAIENRSHISITHHFSGLRTFDLNYNESLDGFGFGARMIVRNESFGTLLYITADGAHSASIVDITDAQGNSLRNCVSFQSGMTFAANEAVPEPASLAIWGSLERRSSGVDGDGTGGGALCETSTLVRRLTQVTRSGITQEPKYLARSIESFCFMGGPFMALSPLDPPFTAGFCAARGPSSFARRSAPTPRSGVGAEQTIASVSQHLLTRRERRDSGSKPRERGSVKSYAKA
jgi:hypothetical protein